jgi:prepilin-type N-terminal cleavage/methylation domain-containing protein
MDMHIKPANHKARRKKEERGFTLTEIAIVLGIIGLILGAIWVAAAAVYTNMRTSKTTTELLDIVQNMRAMYATSGVVDPTADMTFASGLQAAKALTYIQGGIFPADTINAGGTGVQDPWNGYISVVGATDIPASAPHRRLHPAQLRRCAPWRPTSPWASPSS